ncbi:BQ2448_7747 [Microbotryum intermedium]|uniref:BQ2448_7747 protein n=1 Tax=Microbotryum intermedium TaxID=269621 RepID=A0A238FU16_9BASI|nr:BQ2448_7747 [Microbotryum intermedium]
MPTLLCTGCSSGLGLQALRQLYSHAPSSTSATSSNWRLIIGARDVAATQAKLATVVPSDGPKAQVLHLDLESFESVRTFSDQVKLLVEEEATDSQQKARTQSEAPEREGIQCILLNAAVYTAKFEAAQGGWCKEAIVNTFSQHLLLHLVSPLLKPTSLIPHPRVIVTSSGLHTKIPASSIPSLPMTLKSPSTSSMERYRATKFTQMANAHHWKSNLKTHDVDVVAISPGFVPTSGLNRQSSVWARFFLRWILWWFPFVSTDEQGKSSTFRVHEYGNGRAHQNSAIPPLFTAENDTQAQVEDPPVSKWLKEARSDDGVLYVDVHGKRIDPHPAMLEQGRSLWNEWAPSAKTMLAW